MKEALGNSQYDHLVAGHTQKRVTMIQPPLWGTKGTCQFRYVQCSCGVKWFNGIRGWWQTA